MLNLKNWRTDIKIDLPRVHWIRQKHYDHVADSLVVSFLKKCFWLALYGGYSLYNDLSPIIKNLIDKINI